MSTKDDRWSFGDVVTTVVFVAVVVIVIGAVIIGYRGYRAAGQRADVCEAGGGTPLVYRYGPDLCWTDGQVVPMPEALR